MKCCKCDTEVVRISDWEADEVLGRFHINNQDCYASNFFKCPKCNELYFIKLELMKEMD